MKYKDIINIVDTEEFLTQMIKHGYIAESGKPLKCGCGSIEFKEVPTDYINSTVCEFNAICKSCGEIVGIWAHGSWML